MTILWIVCGAICFVALACAVGVWFLSKWIDLDIAGLDVDESDEGCEEEDFE